MDSGTLSRCMVLLALGLALPVAAQQVAPPGGLTVSDGETSYSCGDSIEVEADQVWLSWVPSRQFSIYAIEVVPPSGESEIVELVSGPYLLVLGEPGEYCWRVAGGYTSDLFGQLLWSDWSAYCCFTVVSEEPVRCGNGVCDPEETAWSCPQDCALPAGASGRAGWPARYGSLAAAVGGEPGVGGTFWRTEGLLYNTGAADVRFELAFVADNRTSRELVAGPFVIAPEAALYFADLVGELWGLSDNGSVRLRADGPLVFTTRTFTGAADGAKASSAGTYGQGVHMVPSALSLSAGEEAYLLGLSEDDSFRTNILVQAVADRTASVELTLYDGDGSEFGSTSVSVPAGAKVQRLLRSLFVWLSQLSNGFMTVRVTSGGPVVVIASVVDQLTGDATTVDAVHPAQVAAPARAAASSAGAHALVATVARVDGSNDTHWRSQVHILNPAAVHQTVLLEYRPRAGQAHQVSLGVDGNQQVTVDDVVGELFPAAGDGAGALHVYSPEGVIVSSRTFNQAAGTFGQAIPGLGPGDLIGPAQTGVVAKLHRTVSTRCNMGFTEYQGVDTTVAVTLFARTAGSIVPLASRQYTVPAFRNLQVNKIFDDMNVDADYAGAIAWVTVVSPEGRVYAYASNVDNVTGDAEFVPAQLR